MKGYIQGGQQPSPKILAQQRSNRELVDRWNRVGEWFLEVVEETRHPRRAEFRKTTVERPYQLPKSLRSMLTQEGTCTGGRQEPHPGYTMFANSIRMT